MSYDLCVKMPAPMDNEQLLLDCADLFSGLLHVSSRFEFAFFDRHYLGPVLLGENVYLDEIEWAANPPWLTEEKAGLYAFVTTGGNVPLRYVVAATVIIAIAQQSGGFITDTATRWIKPEDRRLLDEGYDAQCFFQGLRNPHSFEAVEAAVAAFDQRLPVHLKKET